MLEKILEEIEIAKNNYLSDCFKWYRDGLNEAERIIRKHMNGKVSDGDLISRQALLEDFQKTITEQSDTMDWLNMIARQKAVSMDDGWVPVEKRLPENKRANYEVTFVNECGYEEHGFAQWYDGEFHIPAVVIAWREHLEPYRPEKGERNESWFDRH